MTTNDVPVKLYKVFFDSSLDPHFHGMIYVEACSILRAAQFASNCLQNIYNIVSIYQIDVQP